MSGLRKMYLIIHPKGALFGMQYKNLEEKIQLKVLSPGQSKNYYRILVNNTSSELSNLLNSLHITRFHYILYRVIKEIIAKRLYLIRKLRELKRL